MECQLSVPTPTVGTSDAEDSSQPNTMPLPLETALEPSEPVRMKKPRAPRKKKLEAISEATSDATSEKVVQPLLDPLFWAALLNTHNRMLKSEKHDQYSTFRLS